MPFERQPLSQKKKLFTSASTCTESHNKYYEVKAKLMDFNCTVVETSESINDNDSELNAITYTFPKGAFLWGDLDQDQ